MANEIYVNMASTSQFTQHKNARDQDELTVKTQNVQRQRLVSGIIKGTIKAESEAKIELVSQLNKLERQTLNNKV